MLLTIIIPVFNTEKYLNSCLESILVQMSDSCEIILINDGSADSSGKICDEFSSSYNNITVIHQKNSGVSTARNKGIRAATGRYITFVDSDDLLEKDWLNVLHTTISAGESDMVTFSARYYMATGKPVDENVNSFTAIDRHEVYAKFADVYTVGIGSVCFSLYRLELIKKYNIFFDTDKNLNEETYFNLKVFEVMNSFKYINKELYLYRIHQSSSSNRGSYNLLDIIEAKVEYYKAFLDKTGFISPESPEEMLRRGVYLQFMQAVISTNNLTFKERNNILHRIYSNNVYYNLLLNSEEINSKGLNMTLCRLSVKTKIELIISFACTVKKFINKKGAHQ